MRRIIIGLLTLFVILALIGCQNEPKIEVEKKQVTIEEDDATARVTGEVIPVVISSGMFSPREVEIQVGDTIEWSNKLNSDVTITFENGDFDERLGSEGTITYTFLEPGEYGYFSILQPGVRGVVTVIK